MACQHLCCVEGVLCVHGCIVWSGMGCRESAVCDCTVWRVCGRECDVCPWFHSVERDGVCMEEVCLPVIWWSSIPCLLSL